MLFPNMIFPYNWNIEKLGQEKKISFPFGNGFMMYIVHQRVALQVKNFMSYRSLKFMDIKDL